MAKGVSAKFKSYEETIPKFLSVIKFDSVLKGKQTIVLKPTISNTPALTTSPQFVEEVLKFCMVHKDPEAKLFIAEGFDGGDTQDAFENSGYRQLSEKYSVGLIDLNTAEVEEIQDGEFIKFPAIHYPTILKNSYVVSLPRLAEDPETEVQTSLSTMLGAFPSSHYSGIFSSKKSKIRKHPLKYSVHDILRCKLPDVALIDASDQGYVLAGKPIEIDKQAVSLLGKDWKAISHLRLVEESFAQSQKAAEQREIEKKAKEALKAAQ